MKMRTITGIVLAVIMALVAIMPLVVHAIPVWGGNPRYSGNALPNGSTSTSTSTSKTVTLTNTTTTYTITKTYTQVVSKTYVINHYIEYYMYPVIQWIFTLVNIGSQQAPGYHSIGNQLIFTPGFGGGSGIFVPVFAQEAVYIFNIAPSTKPVITGWYTGKTSQSSSPPQLASQSVNTYLSGIQDAVNTIQNQTKVTLTNTTKTTTDWYYINGGGGTTGAGTTKSTTPQPTTNPESWITFWKAGPGGVGGTTVTWYGPGGVKTTYKPPVFGSPPSLPPITLPPGLLPPGVNSPPPDKYIHSGALAGVPIIGSPVIGPPISGLGGVLSGVGNAILNDVKSGWNWLVSHI